MNTPDDPGAADEDVSPPARPESAWRRFLPTVYWLRERRFAITLTLLIASFVLVVLWRDIVVSNRSGEQGVYWSRFFGGTSDMILGEGTHLKFPWDEIIIYSTRLSEAHGKTRLLTKDGMEIDVEWSARYRVDPAHLPELHRTVGPEYATKVVVPEVISTLRQILGNYTAAEIYARDEVSLIGEIHQRVRRQVQAQHPLLLETVLLLRVDLPSEMSKGIVDKLLAEQSLLTYDYRLQAEEQEKRRKTIEAEGIRAFEDITGVSILKWRGIDATQELAKSPNSKIIIMGTGPNNLPILLNADPAGPQTPQPGTTPTPAQQRPSPSASKSK